MELYEKIDSYEKVLTLTAKSVKVPLDIKKECDL